MLQKKCGWKKVELVLLILVIAGFVMLSKNIEKMVVSENVQTEEKVVVLDAGHGGEDPGKVGVNNSLEKDINLQIAVKVKGMLEEKGFLVVMTREIDEMLCDESSDNKKQEDMKARITMINNSGAELAVSIHQNSYTDPDVSGAQVFYYSGSKEGELAANLMQEALLEIDENNHRQAKENSSYYLLKHTEIPMLIVECGFLSNPQEAEKLITEEYQQEISNAIVHGIESCFEN